MVRDVVNEEEVVPSKRVGFAENKETTLGQKGRMLCYIHGRCEACHYASDKQPLVTLKLVWIGDGIRHRPMRNLLHRCARIVVLLTLPTVIYYRIHIITYHVSL